LPTITATVHQVLRYFFVGALATAFVAVPPGQHWGVRFTWFLTEVGKLSAPLVGIAMLIVGSLLYLAHRVVLYPWIFRHCILLRVLGRETSEQCWRRWLWPYGKAVSSERYLEQLGACLPDREGPRFMAWASECHLCYLATEIALFTLLVWPGWRVNYQCAWGLGLCLFGFLVAAWDRQAISLLVDRATNPVPK
jgi:hypothetical protein